MIFSGLTRSEARMAARITFAASLALFFAHSSGTSCGRAQPESMPADVKSEQQTRASEQSTDEAIPQQYSYQAVGKRNPFQSYFEEIRPDESTRRRSKLERLELDQLKLVAVMIGTASPRAMVEDPDGRGHVVKVGTLIGRNGGQIKRIGARHVVIHEEVRTPSGRFVHPVTMRLPEEKLALFDE
jgi:type IV pilus assembly protein PilP